MKANECCAASGYRVMDPDYFEIFKQGWNQTLTKKKMKSLFLGKFDLKTTTTTTTTTKTT